MSKRLGRISEEIKKIVSNLMRNELKDPRISSMASINKVEVTKDLRIAKIYVTVLGNESEQKNTIIGLERAKGFIRREMGKELGIRYTPQPIFLLDKSIEHGIYISELIDKINKQENRSKENE